jgi:hypothetical protein
MARLSHYPSKDLNTLNTVSSNQLTNEDKAQCLDEFKILEYEEDASATIIKHGKRLSKPIEEDATPDINMSILEKLNSHPCHIMHAFNPGTKRMNKVITCLYAGCGKKFTKTWNVLDHFKIHTGDKPFICPA